MADVELQAKRVAHGDAAQPADDEDTNPGLIEEESAWIFSKYLYSWITPLFTRGNDRDRLKQLVYDKDLLHLPTDEDPQAAYEQFQHFWNEELAYVAEAKKNAATPELAALVEPRLFRVLLRTFRKDVLISAVLRFISDGLGVAAPFFLRELIKWLGYTVYLPSKTHEYVGFIWAVTLAVNQVLISITNNASMFHIQKAFCNMRSVCVLALFDKSTKLDANHGITGFIQQMHGSDSYKFIEMSLFLHQLWAAPCIIIAALVALYYFIGWAGVLALGVILVMTPIQGVVAGKMMAARAQCVGRADKRIGAINEIMQGIRIVKFMGWEERFKERVAKIREKEVELFGTLFFTRSIMVIFITFLPMLVSFFVFCVAYKGFDFNINPVSIFPSMSMLNVLRMPLTMLPMGIGKLVDLFVSVDRIRGFLLRPDKVITIKKTNDVSNADAIVLRNVHVQVMVDAPVANTSIVPPTAAPAERAAAAAAAAASNASTLIATPETRSTLMADLNLTIPRGKLTLMVGSTGCGKSTIMNTMIGETLVTPESEIVLNGQVAYITQEAWIMNATLRENILTGKPFDHDKYLDALNDCQLIADLEQLPASDMTEIGERGVNVSGGQKQRIAFARAVYSDRDIILMDDPLSAVDSHVCVALFEDCITKALAGRTRVLVTHQVQFLPAADWIIVVDNCQVVFQGTYADLQSSTVDVVTMLADRTPASTREKKIVDEADAPSPMATSAYPTASPREQQPEKEHVRVRASVIPPPNDEEVRKLMTVEHQVQGGISANTIGWYFTIQGPVPVFLSFLFFVLWRAVSVVGDLLISWWSARTKVIGRSLTQDQYLTWYGVFIGLTLVCLIVRQYPFVLGMLNAARSSNSKMVDSLLHAPTSFFDTTPTGRVIARFSKDMEQMDIMIPESLNFFYNLVLVILGAYAVMIYSAPYLCITLAVVVAIFAVLYRFYTTTNRAQKRLEATNRSPMSSVMNETLGGLATIRAYGVVENFSAKHLRMMHLSTRSVYSWRNSQRWLSVRVDGISAFIIAATALITCGLLVSYDRASQVTLLPIMSLAITYSVAIGGAFGFLTTMTADLESAMSSVERVKEYCDELPRERSVEYGTGPEQCPPPPPEWPQRGEVHFQNVSLRYRDGLPLVLKNITLKIEAGHKVGIVGRTGSGKSTIMLALFRMVELAEGVLSFDGIDIAKVAMQDLRSKITIIPQDPLLFQGTIRSNLDPFFQATDQEIWSVLERVQMADRVRKDGQELDCPVAEKGSNFSVGQRQLICLARALLKRCKILLLDEATASVDFDSDAMIQRTIRTEFKDCTVLTIAHRLATVIDSDRIVVLDHGELQEFDSPAALIRSGGQFNRMLEKLGEEQYQHLREAAFGAERATK